ncbi:MAG: hypothetical protein LC790_22660 [Actinobacteria bacterium]|nr:hypothetical protein [Actinomycetota bacterium]MCA1701539.1 hypothetical protein [Actinomycetota bacterium]
MSGRHQVRPQETVFGELAEPNGLSAMRQARPAQLPVEWLRARAWVTAESSRALFARAGEFLIGRR